jgi:hypothetical protein
MFTQPVARVRAPRDDRQPFASSPIEGGPDEPPCEAAPLQRLVHSGVDQYEPVAVQPVDELALDVAARVAVFAIVADDNEPMVFDVIDEGP